jgi:hypothetical protein
MPPTQPDRQPRIPAAAELRLHWIATLDAAANALEAALRARILPADTCAVARQALNRERAWLETVVWPGLP